MGKRTNSIVPINTQSSYDVNIYRPTALDTNEGEDEIKINIIQTPMSISDI